MQHIAANRSQHLRRLVPALFRLMIAAAVVFAFLSSASAQTAVTPSGKGTKANPYRITVVGNLAWMSKKASSSSGKYYKLMNHIDASETAKWDGGKGFVPIGSDETPFEGVFDGNNKKITGLTIDRPQADYVGLFGRTDTGSKIKNLGLEGFTIVGRNYCGGLVGELKGGGSISHCYSTGSVSGYWYCGGLVGGQYDGSISNCYSTGSVSGNMFCGGLVGRQGGGSISNCYSTGSVSGCGIYQCFGLVNFEGYGTLANCYYNRETGGQSDNGPGTPKTTAEMKRQATFSGWDFAKVWKIVEGRSYPYLRAFGRDDCDLALSVVGPGTIVPDAGITAHSYGTVVSLSAVAADNCVFVEWIGGSVADPTSSNTTVVMDSSKSVTARFRKRYEIRTLSELQAVNDDLGGHYILMNDIDASETTTWDSGKGFVPIGSDKTPFEGVFDGNNKKITGLTIDRPGTNYIGLFGKISNSTIKNLGLEDFTIAGYQYCGGLAGYVSALSSSTLCVTNCYTSGSVSGRDNNCGGLVGEQSGGSISNCYSSGSVSCGWYCGGLVGTQVFGSMSNCYSSGSVSSRWSCGGLVGAQVFGSMNNCYSSGSVGGNSKCGGLVGVQDEKTTTGACYYDTETSGQSDTGKGTPKTTAEMKQRATFAGWDFAAIWGIKEKESYPYLLDLPPRQP